jgi:Ca-activated chloride channel family protein
MNGIIKGRPANLVSAALWMFLVAACCVNTARAETRQGDLLLVLDASGSMWGQVQGENKIVIARRVLGEMLDRLPEEQAVGLIAYGHRREGDCADIELLAPLAGLDRPALKQAVQALNPKGKTPITGSVEQAFQILGQRHGGASLVVLTDGLETCGGDPCAAVRAAKQRGIDFRMHIIGFDVAGEDVTQLECMAQAGGGRYWSAENAGELAEALSTAVATPVEVPDGRLILKAVADGELEDVSISVQDAATGKDVTGARTYRSAETNPRELPLADGSYKVAVQAIRIKGAPARAFDIEIRDGATVKKDVDFSTGDLAIGVTRNGTLSDAVYQVYVPGEKSPVAQGRTYKSASSNPAQVRISAGDYEVKVSSVEIAGRPAASLGKVTVEPKGRAQLSHEFKSGTLKIGVVRGAELVDAVVAIHGPGGEVASGRTYKSPSSNPKSFVLEPGDYRVEIAEIRGVKRQLSVAVGAAETVERTLDLERD